MGTKKQIVINEATIRNMVSDTLKKVLREMDGGMRELEKEAIAVLNSIDFSREEVEESGDLDWEYQGDHCYKAYDTANFEKDGWKFDVEIYWTYNRYDETLDWDIPKFSKVNFISPDGRNGEFEW